jgi:hypothetical protein
LEVLQTRQNVVLDLELCLHAEPSTLLDGEGLLLQSFDGTRCAQVDNDIIAAFDFKSEGEDDTPARVIGVGDVLALSKTKGFLPLLERLVVLVCGSTC